jgi:GT2 family glycosyltransferase
MPPVVSAIVVNLNGGAMLLECLESLFAQTWTDLEVILVDNGSRDGSAEAARSRFGERLRFVGNDKNLGFARGNNQGFEIARGQWMFLLNNDAVVDRDCIATLMGFVADRPEVGSLACRVVRYDQPNFFDSTGLLLYPDGVCRSRGWEEKDIGQYDRAEDVLAPHGCAAAYRRTMLDEAGWFDESYFAYLEDLDLGMRAQLCGWTCWYVPDARVRHRKSKTSGNASRFKAYHVERNRIFNAIKLLPRFVLVMSPFFTINRYLLQGYAAATHRGISAEFLEHHSWFESIGLLLRARLAAAGDAAQATGDLPAAEAHRGPVVSPHQPVQAGRHRAGPEILRKVFPALGAIDTFCEPPALPLEGSVVLKCKPPVTHPDSVLLVSMSLRECWCQRGFDET